MTNQPVPRAEIEERVAQLMEANHEATDEQVNEVAQLCIGVLLDIRDLLAEPVNSSRSDTANKTSS